MNYEDNNNDPYKYPTIYIVHGYEKLNYSIQTMFDITYFIGSSHN